MRRIKHITCIIVLLAGISMNAGAQKKITGIYRSLHDYLDNRPGYTANSGRLPTITLYTLAPRSYVTIRNENNRIRVYKNDIFAYRLANGEVYRIAGNHSFRLLNNNPLLLLYKRSMPASPKAGPEEQFKYYFSTGDGKIQALTAWNIKQAFAHHATLPDEIDALFKRDAELLAYDSFRGMYKLEWLVNNSR